MEATVPELLSSPIIAAAESRTTPSAWSITGHPTALHYENGVSKNTATSRRFKGMVRVLKKLRIEMEDAGNTSAAAVPGYLLECLVWNAPNWCFDRNTWEDRVQSVLRFLWQNTKEATLCDKWCEVDDIKYLFHYPPTVRRRKSPRLHQRNVGLRWGETGMKLERIHITAFVVIAAIIWLNRAVVPSYSRKLGTCPPLQYRCRPFVGLGLLFEFVLWRQPLLHGWFVRRPDLRGTWRVELQSSYIRPESKERVPMIICYMGVIQTLSVLQMHLMTPESESWFIAAHIRPSPSGNGFQVIGVYTNEPNVHLRDKRISEMHQGAIIIETHGPSLRPTTLTAKYWTDRHAMGTMDFTARVCRTCAPGSPTPRLALSNAAAA